MHSLSQSAPPIDVSTCPIPVWTFSRDVRGSRHFMLWRPYAQPRVACPILLNLTGEPKLNELRREAADERIETVGAELRGLMHRAPQPQADPA